MPALKKALDAARPSFSTTLKTLQPDLVLYDYLHQWVPEEATLLNIPAVLFWTAGAATCAYFLHECFKLETEFPFPVPFFRDYEIERHRLLLVNDTKDSERLMNCVQQSSDIILKKTFGELEGKYIDYCSIMAQKKFVTVGPLVQATVTAGDDHSEIIEWLDRKNSNSTVFASFGSEYFLSEVDIEEIAYGLELSGVNFIWAVRFPIDMNNKIEEKLPKGFLERVAERGIVVDWAPQRKILAHSSVGGFVSHCGWSSVMESFHFGVPVVALPMHLDQPLNAKLVADIGLGEEVIRNKEGNLEREAVAGVIRKVVVEKGGENLRRKVKELSKKMWEIKEEEIDGAVEEMVKLCKRREMLNLAPANSMKKLNLMVTNGDGLVENA
ncbi:beta-D-glucosyl crocetin beta-1,6-glucosyltransferase-like [Olea europaea subsp. europaea]|uniref:Beta-D-glucosyl crocetin beta-1,6-glucosyltransferase-like n=1 Tax=Olea europaea subsp. europaea TaxID=158383 RepID=A0A8S0T7E6_OLEEU|nr:beta-D-glucosyl crocetin beta-1,6-glucosyltransferase-like [Olea europaea subsp. europaea]